MAAGVFLKNDTAIVALYNGTLMIREIPVIRTGDGEQLKVTLAGFMPQRAQQGTTVTLFGNFSSLAAEHTVSFNNIKARVLSSTGTELKVTVPDGNATGTIQVTLGKNTVNSQGMFTLLPKYSVVSSFEDRTYDAIVDFSPRRVNNQLYWVDGFALRLLNLSDGSYPVLVKHLESWNTVSGSVAQASFMNPIKLAIYNSNSVLVLEQSWNYYTVYEANQSNVIFKGFTANDDKDVKNIFFVNQSVYFVNVGNEEITKYDLDGHLSSLSKYTVPNFIGMDQESKFYSYQNYKIYRTNTDGKNRTLLAGSTQGDVDGAGQDAKFNSNRIEFICAGSNCIYVSDMDERNNTLLKKVTDDGMVTTVFVFDGQVDDNFVSSVRLLRMYNNTIYSVHNRRGNYARINRVVLDSY